MNASPISRLICTHDFYWSRKRQADVCRRCGALSPVLALHFRSKSAWTVGADLPPERGNGFEADPAVLATPTIPAPAPAEAFAQIPSFAPDPTPPPPVEPPVTIAPLPTPPAQIVIVELTPPAESAPEPVMFAPEAFVLETFASDDPFSRPVFSGALTDFSGRDAAPLRRPLVT